jgi:aerobic carbon-monoxide dehydrogenase small subunit
VDTTVTLTINGERHSLRVPAHEMLAETLRERLALTGTKIGCDLGICGACTGATS